MDRSAEGGHAFFAYATNYLIDMNNAIIVDVEASRAIRQAEVGAARTMIERTQDRFDLYPERLAADSAYGSAEMLGWLVHERGQSRISRSSTSPSGATALSKKPTLSTTTNAISIPALAARSYARDRSPTKMSVRLSTRMAWYATEPASTTAIPAP